jgi:hypothetical protein
MLAGKALVLFSFIHSAIMGTVYSGDGKEIPLPTIKEKSHPIM